MAPPRLAPLGQRRIFAEEFSVSVSPGYDGAVFGNVGRKLVEGTVGLFALLGFLYVPLGRHTGFEHAQAVLSTPQASAAIEDLTNAALRLRARAFELFTGHLSPPSISPIASARR